jgi:BirA family biotin operon repressor/biotin-[acetyl-CoA-carboxylase] ligase
MNIIKIDSCLSTNSFLKNLSERQELEEGTMLIAGEQTAGRGQAGNQWESEAGKNLTFSLIFYPVFLPVRNNFLLSEAIALGVKDVLDSYVSDIFIKWSNDIYYRDKKIAGILIENAITGKILSQSIAGIGINLNQEQFLSGAPNPISLKQITGQEANLDSLSEQLSVSIFNRYKQLRQGETEAIAGDYYSALYRKDGFYPYKDRKGLFRAKIESVGEDGFLRLIDEQGEKRSYAFKEVSAIL